MATKPLPLLLTIIVALALSNCREAKKAPTPPKPPTTQLTDIPPPCPTPNPEEVLGSPGLYLFGKIDGSKVKLSSLTANALGYSNIETALILTAVCEEATEANIDYACDYRKFKVCLSSDPTKCFSGRMGSDQDIMFLPPEYTGQLNIEAQACVEPYRVEEGKQACGNTLRTTFNRPAPAKGNPMSPLFAEINGLRADLSKLTGDVVNASKTLLQCVGDYNSLTDNNEKTLFSIAQDFVDRPTFYLNILTNPYAIQALDEQRQAMMDEFNAMKEQGKLELAAGTGCPTFPAPTPLPAEEPLPPPAVAEVAAAQVLQAAPALKGFVASAGVNAGEINLSWTLPSDTSTYASLSIRALAGKVAPADSCSDGTVIFTKDAPISDTSYTYLSGTTDGSTHSFRACIESVEGKLTASNTTSSAAAAAAPTLPGAPPALLTFTATTGTKIGTVNLAWTRPADTSLYDSLVIRVKEGEAAPAGNCLDGTEVLVVSSTMLTSTTSFTYSSGKYGGQTFSFRACIRGTDGKLTSSNSVSALGLKYSFQGKEGCSEDLEGCVWFDWEEKDKDIEHPLQVRFCPAGEDVTIESDVCVTKDIPTEVVFQNEAGESNDSRACFLEKDGKIGRCFTLDQLESDCEKDARARDKIPGFCNFESRFLGELGETLGGDYGAKKAAGAWMTLSLAAVGVVVGVIFAYRGFVAPHIGRYSKSDLLKAREGLVADLADKQNTAAYRKMNTASGVFLDSDQLKADVKIETNGLKYKIRSGAHSVELSGNEVRELIGKAQPAAAAPGKSRFGGTKTKVALGVGATLVGAALTMGIILWAGALDLASESCFQAYKNTVDPLNVTLAEKNAAHRTAIESVLETLPAE